MDPIEAMLRSINPVPDETAPTTPAPMPDLAATPRSHARPSRLAPRNPWFTAVRAAAVVLAAVVVIAAAGFLGVLAEGLLKPQPAIPTPVPSPSTTAAPTPAASPPPSTSPALPAAPPSDPYTGAACAFRNVLAEGQGGQLAGNIEQFPDDFRVLGCAGSWLAFELTDAGYQRLLDQGAGEGAFGVYHFARFNVGGYVFHPELSVAGWNTVEPVGGTMAEKAVEMDRQLQENLGLLPVLRPALVGGAPASPDATPAPPLEAGVDDPNKGSDCSIGKMTTVAGSGDWVAEDMAAHPENYRVVHCAGGWLAFQLSETGRQAWLDDTRASGRVHEGADSFYFAQHDGTAYAFTPGTSIPDWASRTGAGAGPEAMIESLERDMVAAGIPARIRILLLGEPPE
ncbi:hypothetical protein JOF48_002794 [Arthrobacter stackebrandtii]|uniref:Uncharacterized protein n=1 Tax=Arthrobacter stackebrandtii TaxID=272161 RepID=A0ABS4YYW6_9MICC|nr:hypothetical protein [Arthrobacter stackebrandtii]MBP2413995.1 hypothetical protein [Arthrobacter stackebrandtii]PYG99009.1 hypothetical protein CVV67_17375 [Arthrobacter stackebrandtii]